MSPSSGTFVRSLERGLAVIRAFDHDHDQLTLSEVARRTGLPRAVARRFLLTLVQLGYVSQTDGVFALRARVLALGYAYLSGSSLVEVARPHLEHLSAQLHESCSMSVLDGDEVVYVGRVHARKIMQVSIAVGSRFPAHPTSMGRVLLAGADDVWVDDYVERVRLEPLTSYTVTDPRRLRAILREVRRVDHAVVDQELELGLRSIAVPVRGRSGAVVAAMNVSAPLERGSTDAITAELLPPLRAAAAAVEADLP